MMKPSLWGRSWLIVVVEYANAFVWGIFVRQSICLLFVHLTARHNIPGLEIVGVSVYTLSDRVVWDVLRVCDDDARTGSTLSDSLGRGVDVSNIT